MAKKKLGEFGLACPGGVGGGGGIIQLRIPDKSEHHIAQQPHTRQLCSSCVTSYNSFLCWKNFVPIKIRCQSLCSFPFLPSSVFLHQMEKMWQKKKVSINIHIDIDIYMYIYYQIYMQVLEHSCLIRQSLAMQLFRFKIQVHQPHFEYSITTQGRWPPC